MGGWSSWRCQRDWRTWAGHDPGPDRQMISGSTRRAGPAFGLIDGAEVVAAAGDGAEAVRLAEAHHPDVVLMDLRMPGTDGITVTSQLRERLPATRVLVLTTYADQDAIVPALQAGARGYLTKGASAEQIEAAIRAVHAGQIHLAPSSKNASSLRSSASPRPRPSRPPPATTRRAHRPRSRGAYPPRRRPEQDRDRRVQVPPRPPPQRRAPEPRAHSPRWRPPAGACCPARVPTAQPAAGRPAGRRWPQIKQLWPDALLADPAWATAPDSAFCVALRC